MKVLDEGEGLVLHLENIPEVLTAFRSVDSFYGAEHKLAIRLGQVSINVIKMNQFDGVEVFGTSFNIVVRALYRRSLQPGESEAEIRDSAQAQYMFVSAGVEDPTELFVIEEAIAVA